ncbi:MAG: hypothetical protein FWD29_00270 [Micrococcales bacterium]|nr:hypothetical protein [Micrococcales bacterium]
MRLTRVVATTLVSLLLAALGLSRILARWGATAAERAADYPGEDLLSQPRWRATRAISIDAPPEKVWPWIAQIGHGRGGFLGGELLKVLATSTTPPASEILEEFQNLAVGDVIDATDQVYFTVVQVEPPNSLVFMSDRRNYVAQPWSSVHSINVMPEGEGGSRVVLRENADWASWVIGLNIQTTDFVKGLLFRNIMKALKQAAESTPEGF